MNEPRAGTQVLAEQPTIGKRQCPLCEKYTEEQLCPEDRTVTLLADGRRSDPNLVKPGLLIASRYLIEARIGSGGFALVFRARHTATGQDIAIKVLDSSDGDANNDVRRFIREAQVTSRLRHPNTVRVFDFGQEDSGLLYIAMELLTGRTLWSEQKRRSGAFEEHEAVRIAIAVTQSLSEAHAHGLVHRDLGPRNIYLHEVAGNDPVVKVLDFGLVQGGGRPLTRVSQAMGTVSYMSPEQALGERLTASSDLYSLGVTLYWMVCREPPFTASTPHDVMRAHVKEPFPNVRDKAKSNLSDAFVAILERATQKAPAARFEDARAMRVALEQCAATVARSSTAVNRAALWETVPTEPQIDRDEPTQPRAPVEPSETHSLAEKTAFLTSHPEKGAGSDAVRAPRSIKLAVALIATAAAAITVALLSIDERPPETQAQTPPPPAVQTTPAVEPTPPAVVDPPLTRPEETAQRKPVRELQRPKKRKESSPRSTPEPEAPKPEPSTTYLKTKI